MDEETKKEIKEQLLAELKADYHIVSKDSWRSYTSRTIAALLVVGGVTTAAVFAVIYGNAGAATRRSLESLLQEAQADKMKIEAIRDGWASSEILGDITIRGNLTVVDGRLNSPTAGFGEFGISGGNGVWFAEADDGTIWMTFGDGGAYTGSESRPTHWKRIAASWATNEGRTTDHKGFAKQ